MTTLLIDTRQKRGKHAFKHSYFRTLGIPIEHIKLDAGDYMLDGGKVSIDTKANIIELWNNICGIGSEHKRFRNECLRAQESGIKLIVLVENDDGVNNLDDLMRWYEPSDSYFRRGGRKYTHNTYKYAQRGVKPLRRASGKTLAKACITMGLKYGVKFDFCPSCIAGERVIYLLTNGE